VITANFFDERISLYSLQAFDSFPYIRIIDKTYLATVGRPYGICLANMNPTAEGATVDSEVNSLPCNDSFNPIIVSSLSGETVSNGRFHVTSPSQPPKPHDDALCNNQQPTHILVSTHECSYDVPAGVSMVKDFIQGKFPMVKAGDGIYDGRQAVESGAFSRESGGALFAFEIPVGDSQHSRDGLNSSSSVLGIHRASVWKRYTLFRGFKVRGFGGIVSPGAPGLPYVFRLPNKPCSPPLILLAGDCTGT
jgi:hypothetical protein